MTIFSCNLYLVIIYKIAIIIFSRAPLLNLSAAPKVAVVIRSVELYDLVKVKPTETEANTYLAYDSVAHELVETRLSESEAEVVE